MAILVYDIWIISKNTTEITVYEIQDNGQEIQVYQTTSDSVSYAIAEAKTDLIEDYKNGDIDTDPNSMILVLVYITYYAIHKRKCNYVIVKSLILPLDYLVLL